MNPGDGQTVVERATDSLNHFATREWETRWSSYLLRAGLRRSASQSETEPLLHRTRVIDFLGLQRQAINCRVHQRLVRLAAENE